jgi:hypothetical protein
MWLRSVAAVRKDRERLEDSGIVRAYFGGETEEVKRKAEGAFEKGRGRIGGISVYSTSVAGTVYVGESAL